MGAVVAASLPAALGGFAPATAAPAGATHTSPNHGDETTGGGGGAGLRVSPAWGSPIPDGTTRYYVGRRRIEARELPATR